VLGGWLVATWQFSLGFTLGLQLAYLLAGLGALALVWLWRSGRRPPRRVVVATAAGIAVFAFSAVALARPYLRVADDHPEAKRSAHQVSGLSGPIGSYVSAPEENLVWGKATAGVRDDLTSVPEQTLFPGVVIFVLALVGLTWNGHPRRLRIGLGAAVLAFGFLSLGFHEHGAGAFYPYRLLYEVLPGWKGIRVPGRLTTVTSLALALLAAWGAERTAVALAARASPRGARTVAWAAAIVLAFAVLVEGSGFDFGKGGAALAGPNHPRVPAAPPGLAQIGDPQLHLPLTIPGNRRYVLWSSDGFPRLVNGRGSFVPRSFAELEQRMQAFPDRDTVSLMRSLGVRRVVLHRNLAPETAWADTASRPTKNLGVKILPDERSGGKLLVYEVASPR
jgi:hypothetical protein